MILPFVLGIFRVGLGEGVVVCFLGRWVFIITHSNASFLKRILRSNIVERNFSSLESNQFSPLSDSQKTHRLISLNRRLLSSIN